VATERLSALSNAPELQGEDLLLVDDLSTGLSHKIAQNVLINVVWSVLSSSNVSMVNGSALMVDASTVAPVLTLPATPSRNDTVRIADGTGDFASNPPQVARNGEIINGVAADLFLSTNDQVVTLVYVDVTNGWRLV